MCSGYFDELAAEIAALLDACWGHALVLFTSYAAMSAIKERLTEMNLPWDIFTLSRNAVHTTQQFKDSPGSVLLATGAAWEGFDFPGDCVSLLVIPRLPFTHPDALKEKSGPYIIVAGCLPPKTGQSLSTQSIRRSKKL